MAGYKFNYETKVWGGELIRISPRFFRATRLLFALKVIPNSGKLLDVGCGTGDFIEAFSFYKPKLKLFGIDISKKAVTIAKGRINKARFTVADASKLPFPDRYFDVVTAFDLIEHVKNPDETLREIRRVLKPKGVFHAYIPTEGNIFTLEGMLIKMGWRGKEIYGAHPHAFTSNEVCGMLKEAGFEVFQKKWGDHFVHQFAEIFHFSLLLIKGKNISNTVEGYLSSAPNNFKNNVLRLFKNLVASISFYEDLTLSWFPGLGLHISCRK